MSDLEPAEPTALVLRDQAVEIRDETLRALRSVLLRLDERRAELVEEGNLDDLAAGAQDLATIMFDLRAIEYQTRIDVAGLIDQRADSTHGLNRIEVLGVGPVESKGGWTRKGWRSEELLWKVIKRAIDSVEGEKIVTLDGEVVPVESSGTIEAIYDALVIALPITASLSWRTGQEKKDGSKTGLKQLGFDDADYCERIEQPRLATIPKKGTP